MYAVDALSERVDRERVSPDADAHRRAAAGELNAMKLRVSAPIAV